MSNHEKRIREFLSERSTMRGLCPEQIAGANDSLLNTTDLRALLADLDAMRGALLKIARMAEDLKKPCSMDADSPQAIRNGQYMNICYAAHAALKGASHE